MNFTIVIKTKSWKHVRNFENIKKSHEGPKVWLEESLVKCFSILMEHISLKLESKVKLLHNKRNLFGFERLYFYEVTLQYSCKKWNKYFKLRGCLHAKFHPGMKSCLSMVKCLLLFTRFCRDEISSRDERQGWHFIPGWKKEKKTCKHFIPGRNFKMSMFLINFWRMCSNMLSKSMKCNEA